MMDYGARYYDYELGRWHSVDPLAEKYESVSPYCMVLNNPTAFIDPNGMGVSMRQAIDDLKNDRNEYGGTWNSSGGGSVTYFTSREDAENSASQTLQGIPDALMYAELFRRGNAMLPTVLVTGTPGHFRVDPITMSIARNRRNHWLNVISGNSAQSGGGITVDNTAQALSHYLFGDGSSVSIGPKTISALLNHPDFLNGHNQVMNNKLKKNYFYVDMTWTVFHIGDTRVSYSLDEKNRSITYTLFDGDSFSDADFIDEYFMGKRFGEPAFQSDELGPKLERFGGIPYYYIPVNITFHY